MISADHCYQNRNRLAAAVLGGSPIGDLPYRHAISQLRGFPASDEGIHLAFDDSDIAHFAAAQGVFPELRSEQPTGQQDQELLRQLYVDACNLIEQEAPDLFRLYELVTTDLVFVRSTRIGGGSGSHLPGLIGVSPAPTWDAFELAKCLVHEATHLSTFLCDMIFRLYVEPTAALDREECLVLSAVRVGERRPLDKALHSALVAVPIMYLENALGKSDLQEEFLPSLQDCTNGLLDHMQFFTPYGQAVVEDLASFVRTLDYESVSYSLRAPDEECVRLRQLSPSDR